MNIRTVCRVGMHEYTNSMSSRDANSFEIKPLFLNCVHERNETIRFKRAKDKKCRGFIA